MRERQVYDVDMVAHLWAHQSQDSARNATSNFYFQSEVIYSYGAHFPIAKIVTHKGKTAVLITTRGYSNTTAKHIGIVRRACRHMTRLHVRSPLASHKETIAEFDEQLKALAPAAVKAGPRATRKWAEISSLVNDANAYCEFFGLKRRYAVRQAAERQARQDKRAAKKREREEQERREKAKEKLARWIAGDDVPSWEIRAAHTDSAFLRVNGETMETSLGAEFPLEHALRVLPLIRSGKPYKHNGHSEHVGVFRIDEIDEQGNVIAGCHVIKREEIERIAAQLGK